MFFQDKETTESKVFHLDLFCSASAVLHVDQHSRRHTATQVYLHPRAGQVTEDWNMEDTFKARVGSTDTSRLPSDSASLCLLRGHSSPRHQWKKRPWIGKWGRLVTPGTMRRPTPTPLACDTLDVTLPPPAAVTCLASGFVLFFPEMNWKLLCYCCHRLFPTSRVGICGNTCFWVPGTHVFSQ